MNSTVKISLVAVPECLDIAKGVHKIMHQSGLDVRDDVILVDCKKFADGNTLPRVMDTVRRTEVYFFFAPTLGEPEKGMARLAQILNALQLASVVSVKVVMPYFEGRQDRKDGARTPITAKVSARIIENERCVNGFMTFDLHSDQLTLAFDNPVDNLWGQKLLAEHCRFAFPDGTKVGIVAPDIGSVKRADKFAKKSGHPLLGMIQKVRTHANEVASMRYVGDPVTGYHVIFPDDLIDTAGTMVKANDHILDLGALSCTAYGTHWLASPKGEPSDPLYTAEAKLRTAGLRVVTTNTIQRREEYRMENADILLCVPCEDMLARAIIQSVTPGGSISVLGE